MDLMKLRYFYITAKLENISLAAKELLISQPALSKSITTLEAELEMDLFNRNGKRISLNENGKFLFQRLDRIFAEVRDLERAIEDRREEGSGELSIVTTLPYIFTHIIDLFFNDFPHVKYRQVPLSRENVIQFIENGKYDMCITTEFVDHPNVEWIPLFEEEIFLTVPKTFDLAKKNTVELAKIGDISFIGLTNQYSFRQLTDQFCESVGYTPSYRVEVEEATAILQFVKSGRGVSFTPETSVKADDLEVKHLKIVDGKFTRTIGLLKHRLSYPTKISLAFIEHCIKYFEDYRQQKDA